MHFLNNRKIFYTLSGSVILLSFLVFFFAPKNFGIDMTGGLQIEYTSSATPSEAQLAEIRDEILTTYTFEGKSVLSDVNVYLVNTDSIRTDIGLYAEPDKTQAEKRTADVRSKIPQIFSENDVSVTESAFISVGKSFGKFVLDRAIMTLIVCCVGITLYVMFAFRKSIQGMPSSVFGVVTLATLLHDVIVASGVYLLLSMIFPVLKIDTFFVTAILTILGYSINDTIVILDRVRSEYHHRKSTDKRSDKQVFEDSIQISLWRSILTSMTLTLVLIAMLFFGPEALYGFVTLMLLGALIGTYSSIMIAAPLVYDIKMSRKKYD